MQTWEFAFDPKYRRKLALLGIRPDNSRVEVHEDRFAAHFGRWSVVTPWTNVKGTQITRDYTAIKAIGVRGSFKDRGATFGSSLREGLCVCFHEPVPGLLTPLGPLGNAVAHPGLTVTVEDCLGLQVEVEKRVEH